jgi:hypothetical protein
MLGMVMPMCSIRPICSMKPVAGACSPARVQRDQSARPGSTWSIDRASHPKIAWPPGRAAAAVCSARRRAHCRRQLPPMPSCVWRHGPPQRRCRTKRYVPESKRYVLPSADCAFDRDACRQAGRGMPFTRADGRRPGPPSPHIWLEPDSCSCPLVRPAKFHGRRLCRSRLRFARARDSKASSRTPSTPPRPCPATEPSHQPQGGHVLRPLLLTEVSAAERLTSARAPCARPASAAKCTRRAGRSKAHTFACWPFVATRRQDHRIGQPRTHETALPNGKDTVIVPFTARNR